MDHNWKEKQKNCFLMFEDHHTHLVTENLCLGYYNKEGRLSLLQKDINESLVEGELVCLIGPNGSGKSTLIRTIAGLQKPVGGKVFIGSREIGQLTNTEKSKHLSIVLTGNAVMGNITVSEIVALGRYNYTNWIGTLEKEDRGKISGSLKKVGLREFENRRFDTLSDGEKQRVFIAKGLASDAPVMLLDEPTSHLDIPNKAGILSLLRNLAHRSTRAVLVATHELDLALKLADAIWFLLPDKSIFKSTPEELIFSGKLNEVFGNELVSFHGNSGTFSVNTEYIGSVSLKGEGKFMEITARALDRIGIKVNLHSSDDPVKVCIDNDHWIIDWKGKKSESFFLVETCRILRKAVNK
jgi:iron complex transport system ATP-binding protein